MSQQIRQPEANHKLERHGDDREDGNIANRGREDVIVEHGQVVVHANEADGHAEGRVGRERCYQTEQPRQDEPTGQEQH